MGNKSGLWDGTRTEIFLIQNFTLVWCCDLKTQLHQGKHMKENTGISTHLTPLSLSDYASSNRKMTGNGKSHRVQTQREQYYRLLTLNRKDSTDLLPRRWLNIMPKPRPGHRADCFPRITLVALVLTASRCCLLFTEWEMEPQKVKVFSPRVTELIERKQSDTRACTTSLYYQFQINLRHPIGD